MQTKLGKGRLSATSPAIQIAKPKMIKVNTASKAAPGQNTGTTGQHIEQSAREQRNGEKCDD